jgi:hypothetical protein
MNDSRMPPDGEHIPMRERFEKIDNKGAASKSNDSSAPPLTQNPSITQLKHAMSKKLSVNKLFFLDLDAPPPAKPDFRDVFLKTGVDGLPQLYESYQQRRAQLSVHT